MMKYSSLLKLLIAAFFCCHTVLVSAQQNEITDSNITNRVEMEMAWQMDLPADRIDVETKNSIVLLKGSVSNILAKERAVKLAGAIRGVRGVVDEISVDPPAKDDADLQQNIKDALYEDPATDSYEVSVSVKSGKVILTGEVQSWREKQLSELVVKGVKGVKEVQNKLTVAFTLERPYNEIKNEIEQALNNDIRLYPNTIEVLVKGRQVWLEGTVGSVSAKNLAKSYAMTAGVSDVNTEGLKIDPWANNTNLRQKPFPILADDKIQRAVKDVFFHDSRIMYLNPTVTVSNGIVTLSGSVNNLKAKRAAEADAHNVVGVSMVRNNLKVRPDYIPADNILVERVESALGRNPDVDRYDIMVTAWSGQVYLDGEVDTYFEKNKAEDIASNVKGVVKIINDLDVYFDSDTNYRYLNGSNEYFYPTPYSSPKTYYTYPLTDFQVKDNIEDELWWSPFVNKFAIEVEVTRGVATLSGTVNSWAERQAAIENAYEGGATSVIDNLTFKANTAN